MDPQEISAFDAKTHLSRLLRGAEAGASYLILRRGKPVARLTPAGPGRRPYGFKEAAASFRELRLRLRGPVHVRALIKEGRRR
ncbi:MAG: type II toxin-antitoxin system prevent-host-death family antitoxin [Elusimicrobia bacterium]|nr:type II toxin-antitoxin system prevent-host-death family antitoxin [Elusimicrobiota bacterium]